MYKFPGSGQTESISAVLSKHKIPEIQTGGLVSSPLSSTKPFVSQATPNQEMYLTAVASLLQRLSWRYVQVGIYYIQMLQY